MCLLLASLVAARSQLMTSFYIQKEKYPVTEFTPFFHFTTHSGTKDSGKPDI
jgi:hypothetical protein